MIKKLGALLLLVAFSACQPKVDPKDIAKINGYWEIQKVILADGSEKEYTINPTFDYIEIKDNKGFRKKVTPQFDGSFLADDTSESVEVVLQDDKVFLSYSTPYAKWKEELKKICDEEMVVLNKDNNEYHYKRAQAVNLVPNGKEIK